MTSSESVKDLFKQQPKLAQMDSVFYKWFTAMRSAGKPITGPLIIGEATSFYDDVKIGDISVRTQVGIGAV
jgi:hypothetical protein